MKTRLASLSPRCCCSPTPLTPLTRAASSSRSVAETEQEYTTEAGQKAKRLVPVGKVVPGDEVIWTITAKNVCDKAADNIVIANPVPEQMSYVANSAMGVGADITYSLDGKDFKAPTALTRERRKRLSRCSRR